MTSFRRHVPTRFLINQCQKITFLILKSDNIENSRIELKGIVLQVRSNQIKVTSLQLGTFIIFFCFTQKLKENVGGSLGGGRICCPPPLSNYWAGATPTPHLPTPMLELGSLSLHRRPKIDSICQQVLCSVYFKVQTVCTPV